MWRRRVPKVSLGFWSLRTIGRAVGHCGEDGVPKVSLGFWSPRTIGRAVRHCGEDGISIVSLDFGSLRTMVDPVTCHSKVIQTVS